MKPPSDEVLIEAARLRYELARLRDRRTVRAALAVGELRRDGVGAAWTALRGRGPRMDVPGPANVPLRAPLGHLRVLHTGDGSLVASACPHERATPATGVALLRRDRPDLVLVDGTDGWSGAELDDLRRAARHMTTPVVTVGAAAAAAVRDPELCVTVGSPLTEVSRNAADGRATLALAPAVDVRAWSPVGLDDATEAHRRDDATRITAAQAHRQPVVVVPDVVAVGHRRCLELLAAGAVVVTGPDAGLSGMLGERADLVVGSMESLEQRATQLRDDDDRRRRTSVRLRRYVHQHHATWQRLLAIVERLGIDDAPPERVSLLLPSRRPERLAQVTRELAAQSHHDLELILLPHGDMPLPDGLVGVDRVERIGADRPLGAVLNAGVDLATGAYVGKVDDDDRYGTDHVRDQLLALRHSGAELVGKRVHGVYREDADVTLHPAPGGEERWEDHLPGGTLLLPSAVMRTLRWRHVRDGVDTELVRAVHLDGGSCYSTHRYGYVRVRHGDHTYDPEVSWSGDDSPGFDAGLLEA